MADKLDFVIRPCFEQDLDQVRLIYAHHVTTGTASFELEPPSADEMHARWSKVVSNGWPWMVASPRRDLSRVLGYAYASQYHPRPAYARTFEDSVYVAPTAQRMGVGRELLRDIIGLLKLDDARELVAMIGDSGNTASIELHRALGFAYVGTLSAVGFKFDRWLDVVVMQHSLYSAE